MILPDRGQWWGWGVVSAAQAGMWTLEVPWIWRWGLLAGWLLVLLITGLILWRESLAFSVSREVGRSQQCGQVFAVKLRIANPLPRPMNTQLFDHYPEGFACTQMPIQVSLQSHAEAEIDYRLSSTQRGRFEFSGVQIRYPGRWRLWQRDGFIACATSVRLYPRFTFAGKQHLSAIRTLQPGQVHPLHQRSGNGDFAFLRDYLPGDTLNQIDHKSSARLGKWQSRAFEHEHEQSVILMLDGSRRMKAVQDGQSMFDQVLACAANFARVSLDQGDQIGVQVFSDTPRRYLPASRRGGQYRRFMETLFDQYADDHPPDYSAAVHDLYLRQRQRALVVLITVLESGDEQALHPLLRLLLKRHHVMLVNVRPPYLDQHFAITGLKEALGSAARDVYANAFAQMEDNLRRERLFFIGTEIRQLRPQLLNAYLEYKQRLRQ